MNLILTSRDKKGSTLRYAMAVPLALMIASLVAGYISYSHARQNIADDLNDAIIALANENSGVWTCRDTIAAMRQMHATIHKPMIYQATDVNFRNSALKEEAYFTLALVDKEIAAPKMKSGKITSDSIMLVPEKSADGIAIQVQGFADCSMASVFSASDQTVPGLLLTLSILSMTSLLVWRRKEEELSSPASVTAQPALPDMEGIRLTPMQRKFVDMLLAAPGRKVDKTTLCAVLWDNKSNAEESLYTLVRRTKTALTDTGVEIRCNRGESYELHVNP